MDSAALIRNNTEIIWKGAARTVLERARLYLANAGHSEEQAAKVLRLSQSLPETWTRNG